jgi:hypothetical protein
MKERKRRKSPHFKELGIATSGFVTSIVNLRKIQK